MKKNRLLLLFVALLTAATGAWAQNSETYKVTMKSGTKDAEKWTISDGTTTKSGTEGLEGVAKGTAVTLKYNGRLKVKSVTATHDGWDGNLKNIPASAIASDGYTVIVPEGSTLTIKGGSEGTGSLTAIAFDNGSGDVDNFGAAGIGGALNKTCGTINIQGGFITANGGDEGAGIGGSYAGCGDIIISGGTVIANGGKNGAGIGTGERFSSCGNITITSDVNKVKATKGQYADYSIGMGKGNNINHNNCGIVTIGGKQKNSIDTSPYTYEPSH